MHLFLPKFKVPDSLSRVGILRMRYRFITILTVVCIACGLGGCESLFEGWKPRPDKKPKAEKKQERKSREDYEEVYLPGQTGSRLQRRMYVERGPDRTTDKKKKTESKKPSPTPKPKAKAEPKPEAESSPTPKPEEESTPTPAERFR